MTFTKLKFMEEPKEERLTFQGSTPPDAVVSDPGREGWIYLREILNPVDYSIKYSKLADLRSVLGVEMRFLAGTYMRTTVLSDIQSRAISLSLGTLLSWAPEVPTFAHDCEPANLEPRIYTGVPGGGLHYGKPRAYPNTSLDPSRVAAGPPDIDGYPGGFPGSSSESWTEWKLMASTNSRVEHNCGPMSQLSGPFPMGVDEERAIVSEFVGPRDYFSVVANEDARKTVDGRETLASHTGGAMNNYYVQIYDDILLQACDQKRRVLKYLLNKSKNLECPFYCSIPSVLIRCYKMVDFDIDRSQAILNNIYAPLAEYVVKQVRFSRKYDEKLDLARRTERLATTQGADPGLPFNSVGLTNEALLLGDEEYFSMVSEERDRYKREYSAYKEEYEAASLAALRYYEVLKTQGATFKDAMDVAASEFKSTPANAKLPMFTGTRIETEILRNLADRIPFERQAYAASVALIKMRKAFWSLRVTEEVLNDYTRNKC